MITALRKWARTHTEQGRYSPVGIAFHWVMAFLILFQLGWGWYTSLLPAGPAKLSAYDIHAAAGLPVLLLAIGRACWRILIPGPENDADHLGWQTTISRIIHWIFYICFFALPLSGWAMWSAMGNSPQLMFAGLIRWPDMPFHDLPPALQWSIMTIAEDIHFYLVIVLAALVPLHVGAALKHHFWSHHDVLRGILPELPDAEDPRKAQTHKPRQPRFPLGTSGG